MIKKNEIYKFISVIVIIMIFYGCLEQSHSPVTFIPENKAIVKKKQKIVSKKKKNNEKVTWVQTPIENESIINSIKKPGRVDIINFEDVDIKSFINVMMSEVFKLNFLFTDSIKNVKKKITVKIAEDLKEGEAFALFTKILELHNISMERIQNTYVFKEEKKANFTVKGPIVYGREFPRNLKVENGDEVTVLVPFFNISPKAIQKILEKHLSSNAIIYPITELNVLLINGNYENLKYTLSLIDLLDRSQFKEKSIVMLSPQYWNILEFQNKIKELLAAEGISLKNVEKTKGIMFIPIGKLNSIIVISSVKDWINRVLYWMKKIDVPEASGDSKKVYSYKLQNVEVGSVTKVLKEFSKDLPLKKNVNIVKSKNSQNVYTKKKDKDSIMIFPIKETNSIIIVATPVEYKQYLEIIKKIDVPRNQVFVEVIIGEITLENSKQMGLEFWINRYLNNVSFGTRGGLGLTSSNNTNTKTLSSGTNLFIDGILPGTQFDLLINALVEHNKINIISSPKITVVENEESVISIGSDVPVIFSESSYGMGYNNTNNGVNNSTNNTQTNQSTNYNMPYRSIQYINTGIILKVKASILKDNRIMLEINQEISEAQENTKSAISSPEILKRMIKTTLIVHEGEIAFMGGLFQKKTTSGHTGVPILSKIPLLGNLFKKSASKIRKTELVLFINAKTIRKSSDMSTIVDSVKKAVSEYFYLENRNEKK